MDVVSSGIHEIKRILRNSGKPGRVEDILAAFRNGLLDVLGEELIGVYVVGSIVLGDFNAQHSDIDFVVVVKAQRPDRFKQKLSRIHEKIEKQHARPGLNGIYITRKQMGQSDAEFRELFYYNKGRLQSPGKRNCEINPVTLYELKNYGETVYGPPPNRLNIGDIETDLQGFTRKNVRHYWSVRLQHQLNPAHPLFYGFHLGQKELVWSVTGLARQYYTWVHAEVTSKMIACHFCRNEFPEFSGILSQVIRYRHGDQIIFDRNLRTEARRFIALVIDRVHASNNDQRIEEGILVKTPGAKTGRLQAYLAKFRDSRTREKKCHIL